MKNPACIQSMECRWVQENRILNYQRNENFLINYKIELCGRRVEN